MSFLDGARQRWKFHLGVVVLASSCLALFGLVEGWWGNPSSGASAALIVTGCVINTACMLGLTFGIRCPICGAKVLWLAVRDQPIHGWLHWLNGLDACPKCGFRPTEYTAGRRTWRRE